MDEIFVNFMSWIVMKLNTCEPVKIQFTHQRPGKTRKILGKMLKSEIKMQQNFHIPKCSKNNTFCSIL